MNVFLNNPPDPPDPPCLSIRDQSLTFIPMDYGDRPPWDGGSGGGNDFLPESLRNSDYGDILMFRNHLDIFLENIPDEPSVPGLVTGAESPQSNSFI